MKQRSPPQLRTSISALQAKLPLLVSNCISSIGPCICSIIACNWTFDDTKCPCRGFRHQTVCFILKWPCADYKYPRPFLMWSRRDCRGRDIIMEPDYCMACTYKWQVFLYSIETSPLSLLWGSSLNTSRESPSIDIKGSRLDGIHSKLKQFCQYIAIYNENTDGDGYWLTSFGCALCTSLVTVGLVWSRWVQLN